MNERRLGQLNILILIAVLVGIGTIGICTFVLSDGGERLSFGTPHTMNDTWVLSRQGSAEEELIDLPTKLDVPSGEIITITHLIPDDIGADGAICFYTEFQNIIVLVGDTRVYESGVLNSGSLTDNAVPGYHIVDIDPELGDTVTIQLVSSARRFSGSLHGILYGARGDLVTKLIRSNGISYVASLMIFVLVLLLGLSLLFMTGEHVNRQKAAYGLGSILFSAAWIFLENPLMQFLTGNRSAVYLASQILVLLVPLLYVMYLRCSAVKRRYARIFEILIYIYAVNFLTGIVFWLVGVCEPAGYMIFAKVLILIGLLLLCFLLYLAADTYEDRAISGNFRTNVILTAACILETVFQFFSFYDRWNGLVLQIGLFLTAVRMMIGIEKDLIREVNAERDAALRSVGHEKTQALQTLDTAFIYRALNAAIEDLKPHDKRNSRLIYDTSVFMQHNLEAVYKEDLVPFTEELAYIRAYLGMQTRICPGLTAQVEDKVTDFSVPYNTIKPLAEHAAKEAAARKNGKVIVRSYERLDCYAIQIVDNGAGVPPSKAFHASPGYRTIQKRLKTYAKAVIEVSVKKDKGTILTVKIPKKGYEVR